MNIGDFVSFVSSTGKGKVTGFLPDGRVMVDEDGIDVPYFMSELVVLDTDAITATNIMMNSFVDKRVYNTRKKSHSERMPMEIDLHAEMLPTYLRGACVGNIRESQVRYFLDVLKENIGKHGKRFVFILGKGAGILRDELKRELNKRKNNFLYAAANYMNYDFQSALEVVVL